MAQLLPPATFRMTSEAEQLALMRKWLRRELERHALATQDQAALVVAVGELCTNAIQHAYAGAGGQPIRVTVEALADRVVIEVEDFGRTFEPARYVPPDLDTMPERGLGLHLVRRIADDLSVDVRRERGTRWTLVKFRRGAPAESAEPGPRGG